MSSGAILILMGVLFLGFGYMGVPVSFALMAGVFVHPKLVIEPGLDQFGAALLVLEDSSKAQERGATILGYVRAYALTSDAHHATAPDPRGDGARRAMQGALDQAALQPGDVDYVNGHGTGTPANDSAETKAVEAVFGADGTPPISSTKSQIGHNLGAAGAVEAAVSVLALRDGVLPPTVNVAHDAEVDRDIVPNEARPAEIDVVVSNSFAFGGHNVSLVLRGPRR